MLPFEYIEYDDIYVGVVYNSEHNHIKYYNDKNGFLIGWYDSKKNETISRDGNFVISGDHLEIFWKNKGE